MSSLRLWQSDENFRGAGGPWPDETLSYLFKGNGATPCCIYLNQINKREITNTLVCLWLCGQTCWCNQCLPHVLEHLQNEWDVLRPWDKIWEREKKQNKNKNPQISWKCLRNSREWFLPSTLHDTTSLSNVVFFSFHFQFESIFQFTDFSDFHLDLAPTLTNTFQV